MIQLKEAVIVEGKYDKMKLSQFIDGVIIETSGFQIFKSEQKREYIKKLAETCGIVILTDSDRAGFLIRNHIKSFVPRERIKNAYIPEIRGKERRKAEPSREGLLGVEGMGEEILLKALEQAGCEVHGPASAQEQWLDQRLLYADGLLGGADSARLRAEISHRLGLPARISSRAFADALNRILTPDSYQNLLFEILEEKNRK